MPIFNDSLLYGFGYDRALLMDVAVGVETILPVLNMLVLHPTVLLLVWRTKSMSNDIRLGYFSTVVGLMLSDLCIFSLHPYLLSPYSGLYFDGPLSREGRLGLTTIRALFAFTVSLCFPCFVFLTVRMHHTVLRGSDSRWLLSTRSQCALFFTLFSIVQLNVLVFVGFAVKSVKSAEIETRAEMAWIGARGGSLLIFGDFGKPEQMKYELAMLAFSVAVHTPIVIAFSMHSIRRLKKCRNNVISNRTLQMTNQMVQIFDRQLKGAIIHLLIPMITLMITSIVDTTALFPGCFHAVLRFIITILFITNPLQFSLVFIVKMRGYKKLLTSLRSEHSLRSLQYQSIANSKDSPRTDRTCLTPQSTPLIETSRN